MQDEEYLEDTDFDEIRRYDILKKIGDFDPNVNIPENHQQWMQGGNMEMGVFHPVLNNPESPKKWPLFDHYDDALTDVISLDREKRGTNSTSNSTIVEINDSDSDFSDTLQTAAQAVGALGGGKNNIKKDTFLN